MALRGEQVLLRVFLRSTDQHHLGPVYEEIVRAAAKRGLAGATVLRGIYGYGGRGMVRERDWALVARVPVIVEIVDRAGAVGAFVCEVLPSLLRHGMATLERAGVILYRPAGAAGPAAGGGAGIALAGRIPPLSTLPTLTAGGAMKTIEDGVLLRVFVGESASHGGRRVYERIVEEARTLGLAGATVLRAAAGFGAHGALHSTKVPETATNLPVVIELVDRREKIEALLERLEPLVGEGLITMEDVRVVRFGAA